MRSFHKSKSPGAGGAARGAKDTADQSGAAIEATALILPHTKGGRNHVVCVRRAAGRRGGWLARYDSGPERAIRRPQLRNAIGFALTMLDSDNSEFVLDIMGYATEWTRHLDAIMARIGGGS
ncbi:hypothetical protein [Bradyrhizobium centrosematis]|uniref:hypothetical protein n=1 Tax=Bradyrhizobium centrosematis TaxID=1300039 RepID=UPI00388D41A2